MARVKTQDFQFDMSEDDVDEASQDPSYGEDEEDDTSDYSDEDAYAVTHPMDYKPLKLPAAELERIRAEYEVVVVQDFGDDYDLSAEEMRERYQFYSVFERLRTMQSKYRNLANYVLAFREALKCLRVVAEANQVYPVEKFMKLVLTGEIKVSGLKFPKYNGSKGKKSINWERVVQYVLDESMNPEELLKRENEARFEVATEDDIERLSRIHFDGKLGEVIESEYEEAEENEFIDLDSDDDLAGKNIIVPMSAKEEKKFIRIDRSALEGIKQFGTDRKSTGKQLKDFSFQIVEKDFDEFAKIERMDRDRGDHYMGIPTFSGDIANDEDVDRYLLALEEYELYHTKVEYHNKMITMEEARELELKDTMDQAGWNVRAMYNYARDEKKEKRKLAKMEKKRKKMRKRLMKLEALTQGKNGVETKKKKHKKGSKVKDVMMGNVDRALSAGFDSFKAMEKAMEGWDD